MPDEFLTIEQVAQRLALPPEMIRRRIESGDIPVHWVEADGKLEMRVAQEDISGGAPVEPGYGAAPPPPEYESLPTSEAGDSGPDPADALGADWPDNSGSNYPQGLWTPVEESPAPEASPWDAGTEEIPLTDQDGATVPVWRPDPATWEDEPLEDTQPVTQELGSIEAGPQFGSSVESDPAGELAHSAAVEEREEGEEPVSVWTHEQSGVPASAELSPFPEISPSDEDDAEKGEEFPKADPGFEPALPASSSFVAPPAPGFDYASVYEEEEILDDEVGFSEPEVGPTEEAVPAAAVRSEEVAPPSAMVNANAAGAGNLAINSIDARELVAGLFERWERALEQRIQAEQRLRFEAELEQRMRQVRDLRQELDQTRQAQAADLAEREREVMELRNRVRELEQAPRGRGLFRR